MIKLPTNVVVSINELAKERELDQIDFESFAERYTHKTFVKAGLSSVTVSSHCELTLAMHFYQQKSGFRSVEIGVSKRLCWLCQQYVEILFRIKKLRVVVSANQGKIHPGWAMPSFTPPALKSRMHDLIEREVDEIRQSVLRQRSDFYPIDDRQLIIDDCLFDDR